MDKEVKGTKIIQFHGEEFVLSSDRVLYYPSEHTLILSDIHLGKAGHFRKNGIPVPIQINQDNLDRLNSCIQKFNPKKLIFLGDLFHSESNSEWNDFNHWRSGHSALSMTLVLGNHELYSAQKYEQLGLEVVDWIDINGLRLQHEPEKTNNRLINGTSTVASLSGSSTVASISGHLHPGIKLAGKGRQSLILPCFAHYLHQLILPAFGTFTGLHLITLKEAEQLYAIAEDELIALK